MIKILHCADLHLDSPFSLDDMTKSEIRRNELRGVFTSIMLYAKTENIDIVLMAGDLFDSEYVSRDTAALMSREFSSNPNCRFVISPGNHDPYTEESVYSRVLFPDNVYIFENEKLSYFPFNDIGVDVYGYAFSSPVLRQNPFAGRHPRNPARINILCGHGDTSSATSPYCPISQTDITESGFDYIALGHIHNSNGIERVGDTYYGYSGCIEGRDFGETGHKGAVTATLDKSSGMLRADFRGLRFSKRRYEVETLNVSGAISADDVLARIKAMIAEKKYGADTALRCILEGSVSPSLTLSERRLADAVSGLFFIEIADRTVPTADTDALANDPTIRGAIYKKLLHELQNGSPEEREIAAKALRMALSAIDGTPFDDILSVENGGGK